MFGFQNFNDRLGLLIVVGMPILWVSSHWWPVPPEVLGVTISGWTTVILFYFRKAPPPNGNGNGATPRP